MTNNQVTDIGQEINVGSSNAPVINDRLLQLLKSKFNETDQQLFVQNFCMYLNYDKTRDYVIDLDKVWQWMGFSRKDPAKRLLDTHFTEGADYKILLHSAMRQSVENPQLDHKILTQPVEQSLETADGQGTSETDQNCETVVNSRQRGGHNKEQIMLNIKTFKKMCMKANTKRANDIHDYYITMEETLFDYTKDLLREKERELLQYKQATYEQIQTTGSVYIMKTDAYGAHKVGKAKDSSKRVKGLQTGNVDDIEVVFDFPTSNPDVLEKVVHYILDRYRCNSNREFFNCNVEYIKMIMTICGNVIDTLKSTFQHITSEEVLSKLKDTGIETGLSVPVTVQETVPETVPEDNFYSWLEANVEYHKDGVLRLQHVCELYLSKTGVLSRESSKYKKATEQFVKSTFPHINWQYQDSTLNSQKYKGWANLRLRS